MSMFGDMLDHDKIFGNWQDQRNKQLTTEEVRQILDLPESLFFESTNEKGEEGKTSGSISCSSNSFSEMPSEMELCPDQALNTNFPHNDFHCQEFHIQSQI